ncbi:flagellar protein FlgJ [Litorivivens lipolytica]|uniref:Flagellar protein FlgJ n=1 Tax=Litorivivens lipolytica TaxID=1524264 RepID=A0A7W4W3A6_9GAMM|nr:rod-binding protein [Litorivivens lipolytica]MBB3046378.1 flagellar protein FlgJ [Litorivivens lipolytica]
MDIGKQHFNYHDFGGFAEMRREAQNPNGEGAKAAAKQFESLFVQMMLKEMRDSLPEGGLFNDQSLRFYQDMMDKELSQSLVAGDGIGLSKIIERQLTITPEADALRASLVEKPEEAKHDG